MSEQATVLDWKIIRGTDDPSVLTWRDVNGVLIPLTGCTGVLYISDSSGVVIVLTTTTSSIGSITLGPADGQIGITLTKAGSLVLSRPRYTYIMYVTFPGGQTLSPLRGNVIMIPGAP